MYEIVKSVIETGRYNLRDIQTKIDTLWVQESITEEKRTELIALAREKAEPENSFAPMQEQIDALFGKVKDIEARVAQLENGGILPDDSDDEYPEWVQPTGAHDAYHNGDKITYNGSRYLCTAPDVAAVVWPPDVYPDYWRAVEIE